MHLATALPRQISTIPYENLEMASRPRDPRLPEAIPYALYDTQTYPAAGIARLDFFRNLPAGGDRTLSNMQVAGQLQGGQFFSVWRIFLDALRAPTATTNAAVVATGVANDLAIIFNTARGMWTFETANKPFGPLPIGLLGQSGAIEPVIGGNTAPAAGGTGIIQFAATPKNGGFPVNGGIVIPPVQSFGLTMEFVAATAIAVDTPLRVTLFGVLYRRVA